MSSSIGYRFQPHSAERFWRLSVLVQQRFQLDPSSRLPAVALLIVDRLAGTSLQFLPTGMAAQSAISPHHINFNPNWIWRDVVDVAVITPAVGDGPPVADANTTGLGELKLV
jgi:hypothetical protein